MNIIRIDTVSSTNIYLKELLEKQTLVEGTILTAEEQIAGRGQLGTRWETQRGKNITCSIVFYPYFLSIKQSFLLSKVIALGVKEALNEYLPDVLIKWPNDIYFEEKKLVGILIENELTDGYLSQSIAGIGINVNQEIFTSDAPNPVSLKQILRRDIDQDELLNKVQFNILKWYNKLKLAEENLISESYRNCLYRSSGFHLYKDKDGIFLAEITDVQSNGALILKTDTGERRTYFFKEVSFLPICL